MLNTYTMIGPITLQTYTLLLAIGVSLSAAISVYRLPGRPGRVLDACLGGLAGGAIGARVLHVLLNWAHFSTRPDQILQFSSGGLDWHGAVIGGLIGLYAVSRWRGLGLSRLLDALVIALPLLALTGWLGCWAAGCAYGAEVETLAYYPAIAVSIAPDVYGIPAPRYNTQFFGVLVALGLLLLAAGLVWKKLATGWRFWLILGLLSLSMFVIGFFRADYAIMLAGLRADQWLDVFMLGCALVGGWMMRHET